MVRVADNTSRIAALRTDEQRDTSSDQMLSDNRSGLHIDGHGQNHLSVLLHLENAQNSSRA